MTTKRPSAIGLRKGLGTAAASAAAPAPESFTVKDLPPRPEKPVRFTLDLDRERHGFLKQYALHRGADASQVMRALIDELRDDPDLSIRVRDRIWPSR